MFYLNVILLSEADIAIIKKKGNMVCYFYKHHIRINMIKFNNRILSVNPMIPYKLIDEELVMIVGNKFLRLKGKGIDIFRELLSPFLYDLLLDQTKVIEVLLKLNVAGVFISRKYSWNKYMICYESGKNQYVYCMYTKEKHLISKEIYYLLKNNKYNLTHKTIENLLIRNILKYDNINVKEENSLSNLEYRYYIAMSYDCNLKCTYCFENDVYSIQSNKWNPVITLDNILKNHSLEDKIVLTLYGGEPLLLQNFGVIESIIKNYTQREYLYYRIITNGIYVKEFREQCYDTYTNIKEFVITVDGPQNVHDERRMFKNKKGTYKKIVSSIELLLLDNKKVVIRINVDEGNYAVIDELINTLSKKFANIAGQLIYEIHEVTNNKNSNETKTENELFTYQVMNKLKDIKNEQIQFCSKFLQYIVFLRNPNAYFFNPPSDCDIDRMILIDPLGNLYKCNEGMFVEKLLTINEPLERSLLNIRYFDSCIKKCEFFEVCYGGCPLSRLYGDSEPNIYRCEKRKLYRKIFQNEVIVEKNIDIEL